MENFDINALDVRTLRLLVSIAGTGSVSQAAEDRGMSQSTASYGLEKLRRCFADPLFVRSGRGMVPTEKGEHVIAQCLSALDKLDGLAALNHFDPLTAERDFVVAASGFEVGLFLAGLHKRLRERCPGGRLVIRDLRLARHVAALETDWDLALMASPADHPALKRRCLLKDEYVTFYDASVMEAPRSLEQYCARDHAVASLGGEASTGVDTELARQGLTRRVRLVVNSFETLPPMMRGTPLLTTLPRRFGQTLMREFSCVPAPLPLPGLSIYAVWHLRKDTSPAHKWFRQQLQKIS